MSIKKWKVDLAEALPRVSASEVPLVRVVCEYATAADVEKFLTDMGASVRCDRGSGGSPGNEAAAGDGLPLKISLRPISAEEYDFACADGVEVVASPYASLLAAFARIDEVPAGLLRAALMGFLEGEPAPKVANQLQRLIDEGLEDGEGSAYASDASGGGSLFLGRLPPAKA